MPLASTHPSWALSFRPFARPSIDLGMLQQHDSSHLSEQGSPEWIGLNSVLPPSYLGLWTD